MFTKFHPAPMTTAFKTYKSWAQFHRNTYLCCEQPDPKHAPGPAASCHPWPSVTPSPAVSQCWSVWPRRPRWSHSCDELMEHTEFRLGVWFSHHPLLGEALPWAAQGKDPMARTERLLPTQGSTSSSQAEAWPQPDETLEQSHQLRSFRFLQKPRW